MSRGAFGGSIETKKYKRQDGSTRVSYLARIDWPVGLNGERRRESQSFNRKDDAKKWLAEKAAQVGRGVLVSSGKRTVGQFLDQWVKTLDYTSLAVGTRRRYGDLMRLHVAPFIGHRPLDKLTKADVEELYAGRLAAGMDPSTLDLLHNVLHKALDYAVDTDYIVRNVTERVQNKPHRGKKKRQQMNLKYWNDEQTAAFFTVSDLDDYAALWRLVLFTGMRRGEILGLKWSDVDLRRKSISVRQSHSRGEKGAFVTDVTKRDSSLRSLDIAPTVVDSLKRHQLRQKEDCLALGTPFRDDAYVFTNGEGTQPLHPNSLEYRYKRLQKQAGVPRITFHDLRHTFATLMLKRGIPAKIVQEMLGHSSIAITLDIYSHVIQGMQRDAVDLLESSLAEVAEGMQRDAVGLLDASLKAATEGT